MQDFSSVNIKNMIIHNVGNKVKGESLEISTEICDAILISLILVLNAIICDGNGIEQYVHTM